MLEIDRIAHLSRLRRIPIHMRITLPLLCLLALPFVQSPWIGVWALALTSVVHLGFGRVPLGLYSKALLAPGFFVVTAALGILFVTDPGASWVLVRVPGTALCITEASLNTGVLTVTRAYGALGLVYLIAFHATIWEIGQYMLSAKLPKAFVELFILCYRFIFILLEEGYEMVHAQDLRLGYQTLGLSLRALSLLVSQLFLRTLLRVRAMEESLEMRLYQGEFFMETGGNRL